MSNPWDEPVEGQEPSSSGSEPPSEPPYTPPAQDGGGGPAFQPPTPGGQPPGYEPPGQQPPAYGTPGQQPPAGGYPPQQGPPPFQAPPGGQIPQQGYPGYGQQPPYSPGYGAAAAAAPPSSGAQTAMALSISGLVLTLFLGFCCGPFALAGLILCAVGAYQGHQELVAIDAGRADPRHRGNANAARIVGIAGIALGGLFVVGFAALIVIGSL